MRKFVPTIVLSFAADCGYAEPAEQATLAEQEEVVAVEDDAADVAEAEESADLAQNDEALLKVKPAKK
jgi:hypothetical protein